jgi:hypothetical protein
LRQLPLWVKLASDFCVGEAPKNCKPLKSTERTRQLLSETLYPRASHAHSASNTHNSPKKKKRKDRDKGDPSANPQG